MKSVRAFDSLRDGGRSGEAIEKVVPWVLRVGVALCFIGHGAFGIITKQAWVPYFGVVGLSESWAWRLMPWIGTMDVTMGFLALIWPCRALFVWGSAWALWTALLRPLAGEGLPEFFERAGNYGVCLAMLAVVGWHAPWFTRLSDTWPSLTERARRRLEWTLRIATATLLTGHAACAVLLQKGSLAHHYAIFSPHYAQNMMVWVGYGEFGLALVVLMVRLPSIMIFVCLWKLATESLFLLSGAPASMFEVIERGGSYAVPLALGVLLICERTATNDCAHTPRENALARV